LGCDYELFKKEKSGDKIINRWHELTRQGKQDGFFPLLILPEDTLAEALELALEDAGLKNTPENIIVFRNRILQQAAGIDPVAFLQKRLSELDETYEDIDILGDFKECEPDECFYSYMDGNRPYPELLIAKVPAKYPWELAAWFPMGGFNECPPPAEQVAVFKYWYEKYGAVPGIVTGANWEFELTRPPLTGQEAEELAKEHFAFCEDVVVQAGEDWDTIRALASRLKGSTTWYFWWD
jgi:hypothetical protein